MTNERPADEVAEIIHGEVIVSGDMNDGRRAIATYGIMCLCGVAIVSHHKLQLYPSIELSHNFTRNGYPDSMTQTQDSSTDACGVWTIAMKKLQAES